MKIIAVTDRSIAGPTFLSRLAAIASSDVDAVILREKDMPECDLEIIIKLVSPVFRDNGKTLIINSLYRLARSYGLPVQMPMESLREHHNELEGIEYGASVHSVEEADEAVSLGASWLIFGNVFETTCKPGKAAAGTGMLGIICRRSHVPVYAIGGIVPSNAAECIESGAAGVCLRSPFMQCPDPGELADSLRKSIKRS